MCLVITVYKGDLTEQLSFSHLIEYVFVEVRHVPLTGHWAIIIISEMFLKGNRVMWDTQDCAQVVGQDLKK